MSQKHQKVWEEHTEVLEKVKKLDDILRVDILKVEAKYNQKISTLTLNEFNLKVGDNYISNRILPNKVLTIVGAFFSFENMTFSIKIEYLEYEHVIYNNRFMNNFTMGTFAKVDKTKILKTTNHIIIEDFLEDFLKIKC